MAELIQPRYPQVDFSALANLPAQFEQGQQLGRDRALRSAFAGGLPMKNGALDFGAMAKLFAASGDVGTAAKLAQADAENKLNLTKLTMPHTAYAEGAGFYDTNAPPPQAGNGQPGPINASQRTMDEAFTKGLPEWQASGQAEEQTGLSSLNEALGNLGAQVAAQHPDKAIPFPQDPSQLKPGTPYIKDGMPGSWNGMAFVPGKDESGNPIIVSGATPGLYGTLARNIPGTFAQGMGTIGTLSKTMPDYAAANYPRAVATVGSHVRAVSAGMKAVLGSQRAEQVIQQVIDATYNGDLPPEENIIRLKRLYDNIKSAGDAKKAQAEWYRTHGNTLSNYVGPDPEAVLNQGVAEYVGGATTSQAPAQASMAGNPARGGGQTLNEGQTVFDPQGRPHVVRGGQLVPVQ